MIKFGDTETLLPDRRGLLQSWCARYLADNFRAVWCQPSQSRVSRGAGLVFNNYPDPPEPAIGRLVIPTGATRWSSCLLLVDDERKDAIYSEAGSGPLVLQYRTEKLDESAGLRRTLKLTMYPLAPLPLSPRIVNENAVSSGSVLSGGWLIPLVDARYWWQFRNVGAVAGQSFANPTAILTYLTGRVSESWTTKTLHAEHTVKPQVAGNDYEPLPEVLDSVATQLGLTVVPDLTNSTNGAKFVLMGIDDSSTIHTANLAGQGGLTGAEDWGVPQFMAGDYFEDQSGPVAPSKVLIEQPDGTRSTVTAATGGYSRDTVTGSEFILRYRWGTDTNLTTTVLNRIAKDFYGRWKKQHDWSMVGIQQWQPTAFTDCVIHEQITTGRTPRAVTRVRSAPMNLLPTMNPSEEKIHFVLDEALAAATAFDDNPATATASVWAENSSGNLVDTGINETIVNRTDIVGVPGAYGRAERLKDGRWHVYVLNCEAAPT